MWCFLPVLLCACSTSYIPLETDPNKPVPPSSFRDWAAELEKLPESERPRQVVHALNGLRQWWPTADGRDGRLVDLLLNRGHRDLMLSVLWSPSLSSSSYQAIGHTLAHRGDRDAFAVVCRRLEDPDLRDDSLWILTSYGMRAEFALQVVEYVGPVAVRDPVPTTRAYALNALGFTGREEAIPYIVGLRNDENPVHEPINGMNGDTVGRWARQALDMIDTSQSKKAGSP